MKPLYDIGVGAYGLGARLAAVRSSKARDFVRGRGAALAELKALTDLRAPDGYDYWFHVASLGEFEQARPLIEKINLFNPEAKILLTFFSPSGYNVRKDYDRVTAVTYLPADTRRNAVRFLDIARPRKVVFVKYEFWLNFLEELKARAIPTYLISAIFRPGQVFFKPWGAMFRRGLEAFATIYVQDEKSKELLENIGITNVRVTGDTRFDRVYRVMTEAVAFSAVEEWKSDKFTLIVGSSWPQDEQRYIDWVNAHPEVKVIIAPHEFNDRRIAAIRAALCRPSVRWSDIDANRHDDIPHNAQTLIVNTFGKLSSLYRYADAVIVGGGFGAGVHNINEAAVYGVPIVFGPNNRKFKEAGDLKSRGAAFECGTSKEMETILDRLLGDSSFRQNAARTAKDYIFENLGATDIIFEDIKKQTLNQQ